MEIGRTKPPIRIHGSVFRFHVAHGCICCVGRVRTARIDFDHYYGRLRDYYDKQDEKAAKTILRMIANLGAVKRDACYQIYRKECDGADIERFNGLMANRENDFYVGFN